jgi:hypothetical protein
MEKNIIWADSNDLIYNPIYDNVPEFSNWGYSSILTEIAVYGVIKPIVITSENVVIDGNKRLQASRELKLDKVPIQVYNQQEEFSNLLTKEIRPSSLVEIIDIFDKKYNLKKGDDSKSKSLAVVIRNNFLGDKKRVSQLMNLKKLSASVTSIYPIESKKIWIELDSFQISLEQGVNKMKDLYERKTNINFSIEYDKTG